MVNELRDELANLREDMAQAVDHYVRKPLLRGISHLVAFIASIGTGLVLVLQASAAAQFVASIVYTGGLTLALGTSALYHRVRWSERGGRFVQKLDHSMIFVLIASSYTPILLLSLDGGWRVWTMVAVWVIASAGIIMRLVITNLPRLALVSSYIGMGWVAIILMPKLAHTMTPSSFTLLCIGGGLYTIGGIVYLFKRPDPLPRVFGFHEVFHAFVVAAAACHYAAIWPLVSHRIGA
jgi:hemolysin III